MTNFVLADLLGHNIAIGPWRFRHMLPSGVHCQGCHALINVEEAYAGLTPDYSDYVFDLDAIIPLLLAHAEMDCVAADRLRRARGI